MLNIAIISEIQIKATMTYQLTLVRKVIIKKSTNNKCWRGCGEWGTLGTIGLHHVNWCSHYGEYYGGSLKK